jgi:N-acetylglucosamine kinase-like BadF-type ATPase
MEFVVGIDGGGTKTRAVLANTKGEIIGVVQSGVSNFQRVGTDGLAEVCLDILKQLEQKFNIRKENIKYWALGLAGAGRIEDQEAACEAVEALGYQGQVCVQSDAYVALMGAFSGNPGIIIIAGTGSICFGLDEKGTLYRSGGWGYLLGDEGSGFYIGNQSILAALKDQDGRGNKTTLRKKVEESLGIDSIEQIVRKMYIENTIQKENIANLAPIVFKCAQEGDETAKQIVVQTAKEIAKMIFAVGTQMNKLNEPIDVAHIGSVFNQKDVLVPIIQKELENHFESVSINEPLLEPALGSVIWAFKKLDVEISSEVQVNLKNYELA